MLVTLVTSIAARHVRIGYSSVLHNSLIHAISQVNYGAYLASLSWVASRVSAQAAW
jgi:hypothetical protein